MRPLAYFGMFCLGAIVVLIVMQIASISGPQVLLQNSPNVEVELTYTDFVTIMFTAATLALTILAVIIAVAAVFSFQGIKREARSVIKIEVKKQMSTEVEKQMSALDKRISKEAEEKITAAVFEAGRGGHFDEALERAILAIGQGDTKLSGELEKGFDPSESGER